MGALTSDHCEPDPASRISAVLATTALAVVLPLGVAAPKGEVVVVVVAALLSAPLRDWMSGAVLRRLQALPRPLHLLLGGLALWSLIRLPGTNTMEAAFTWLRTVGVVLAGMILVGNLRHQAKPGLSRSILPAGVLVSVTMMAAHLASLRFLGRPLWGNPWWVDEIAPIRSGGAIAAIFIWPAVLLLWRRGWRKRLMGAALFCVPIIAASGSSPILAITAGGAGFAITYFGGRKGAYGIAVLAVAMVVAMPSVNSLKSVQDTVAGHPQGPLPGSADHRLIIWSFVADHIAERPWLGWGFDSSRSIPGATEQPAFGFEYLPLHPHNAALQARLELGVPGAVLYGALLCVLLITGTRPRDPVQATRVAMIAGYTVVGNLSYGIWQSWWVATAWLAAATWITVADQTRTSR